MSNVDRSAAARAIEDFLRALGRDPAGDPELRETGRRVAEVFADHLCAGYTLSADAILRAHVIEGVTGEVLVRDVPVLTTCPHHLMLATGTATVAFSARGRGVGLGAIAEAVHAASRRLVLQEAIGETVVAAIAAAIDPAWAFCHLRLQHGCMRAGDEALLATSVETTATRGAVPDSILARVLARAAEGAGT